MKIQWDSYTKSCAKRREIEGLLCKLQRGFYTKSGAKRWANSFDRSFCVKCKGDPIPKSGAKRRQICVFVQNTQVILYKIRREALGNLPRAFLDFIILCYFHFNFIPFYGFFISFVVSFYSYFILCLCFWIFPDLFV